MVGYFYLFCFSLSLTVFEVNCKQFVVRTKEGAATEHVSGGDYYGRGLQHKKVARGSTTRLRCESPRPFTGCKFRSPSGEVFNIGIGGGSSYKNARIDCLCTEEEYDPTLVCGILIKDLRHEDTGEWRCELEFKRYGKTVTKSNKKYLEVIDSGSTYKETDGCQSGWAALGSMCYKSFNLEMDWKDAERYCQNLGGHLPSIHSVEENNFLKKLSPHYLWLGGTDPGHKGVWRWTDGSPFSFTYWGRGEPNNLGGGEDCLTMMANFDRWNWNDHRCSWHQNYYFVCKKHK